MNKFRISAEYQNGEVFYWCHTYDKPMREFWAKNSEFAWDIFYFTKKDKAIEYFSSLYLVEEEDLKYVYVEEVIVLDNIVVEKYLVYSKCETIKCSNIEYAEFIVGG